MAPHSAARSPQQQAWEPRVWALAREWITALGQWPAVRCCLTCASLKDVIGPALPSPPRKNVISGRALGHWPAVMCCCLTCASFGDMVGPVLASHAQKIPMSAGSMSQQASAPRAVQSAPQKALVLLPVHMRKLPRRSSSRACTLAAQHLYNGSDSSLGVFQCRRLPWWLLHVFPPAQKPSHTVDLAQGIQFRGC